MVGHLEATRFSHVWTFRGPPVIVLLHSQRPSGIPIVGLLEAPRFSYRWILSGFPVIVWLDY